MIRNFKRIQSYLKPDVILFVGDLMDGGRYVRVIKFPRNTDKPLYLREWEDVVFNKELARFKKVFPLKEGTKVMGVAGNHDIGFGETIVLSAHERFIKTFGELNHVTRVANHSFVALDTIGLSGLESSSPHINAFQFLQSLDTKIALDPPERRILITHVPLWRPENVDCGPRRVTKPIRNFRGYQYQNLIQYPIASRVLSIVKPSLTISGTFLSFQAVTLILSLIILKSQVMIMMIASMSIILMAKSTWSTLLVPFRGCKETYTQALES